MNARYIIKRYAKSKRSWNFEIGPKVGYGLYVYDPRYISKMSSKKIGVPPPPLRYLRICIYYDFGISRHDTCIFNCSCDHLENVNVHFECHSCNLLSINRDLPQYWLFNMYKGCFNIINFKTKRWSMYKIPVKEKRKTTELPISQ